MNHSIRPSIQSQIISIKRIVFSEPVTWKSPPCYICNSRELAARRKHNESLRKFPGVENFPSRFDHISGLAPANENPSLGNGNWIFRFNRPAISRFSSLHANVSPSFLVYAPPWKNLATENRRSPSRISPNFRVELSRLWDIILHGEENYFIWCISYSEHGKTFTRGNKWCSIQLIR